MVGKRSKLNGQRRRDGRQKRGRCCSGDVAEWENCIEGVTELCRWYDDGVEKMMV